MSHLYITPVKSKGRRKESVYDALKLLTSVSIFELGCGTPIYITGNGIANPQDILTSPEKIHNQFLTIQNNYISDCDNNGGRLYIFKYTILEGLDSGVDDFERIVNEFLNHYSKFQCCVVVLNVRNNYAIYFIFNNIAFDGTKMTEGGIFMPQLMTKIIERTAYNKMINTERDFYEENNKSTSL